MIRNDNPLPSRQVAYGRAAGMALAVVAVWGLIGGLLWLAR